VFGGALGAGLGWAIGGWFELPLIATIPAGIVIGWVLAQVLLMEYGGRSTR
jgi:fluoride ion exporter CrcB/FEX